MPPESSILPPRRRGRLLVAVRGLSGRTYPPGTPLRFAGRGAAVDALIEGEWVPLRWFELVEEPQQRGDAPGASSP
jgi:hypothetical protein